MTRVVVTGATGFLGMRTALLLKEWGYEIVATGRNKQKGEDLEMQGITFQPADLADYEQVCCLVTGADAVVHCAALSSPWGAYASFYEANVTATKHVVQACKKQNVPRLVHISTPSIYFSHNERLDVKEDDPLPAEHANHYATTKRMAEEIVREAAADGLVAVILRPRALFGPGDTTLLPRIIEANQKSGIPRFQHKEVRGDLTYIDNAVDAIELALKAPTACSGHAFNITNGEPVPLYDVLEKMFAELHVPMRTLSLPYGAIFGMSFLLECVYRLFPGKEPPLTRYSVSVLGKSQTLNIEKAKAMLGYEPRINIEEGVKRFAAWYMQHPDYM